MTDFFSLDSHQQEARLRDAGAAALAHWGITDAELRLIKYRENAVFEARHGGGRHALRLHRSGYHSDAALASELKWMGALAEAGILVPQVVPTRSGDLFVVNDGDGLPGRMQIDLFDWVDGRPLGSVEAGLNDVADVAANYHAMGALAAAVHNQAADWQLPAGFERHAWDADGLTGPEPFWGRFWELEAASPSQQALLLEARDQVHAQLDALPKTPQHYSMIHADFAPENLMVDEHGIRLIDFDDAGFGWHLFELATSLYFLLGDASFDTAREALIAGYRSTRELSDEQLELLPLFLTARGFTYLGWVHTRQETETARELTPHLLETACSQARQFLEK